MTIRIIENGKSALVPAQALKAYTTGDPPFVTVLADNKLYATLPGSPLVIEYVQEEKQ